MKRELLAAIHYSIRCIGAITNNEKLPQTQRTCTYKANINEIEPLKRLKRAKESESWGFSTLLFSNIYWLLDWKSKWKW